ncbi:hypothetical protein, partial [Stenotrophomonas maltophilia]|uniref:hypothetical protein n=1 Tax=Stenotrophomonas maltophilia TaxID=40324 RepID=UPI0019543FD7
GRGIHAADTPATGPTPPSTISRGLPERRPAPVGVDLGRHKCLKNRLLLLIFSFDLPAVRRKLSVAGRVGWLGA